MKKKILTVLSIVLALISMFLVGCSAQETGNQKDSLQASEGQQTQGENVEGNSLFPDTIFDNLILGETSVQDVEKLLDDRILEYKNDTNQSYCVSGKTTITDEFYQWKTLYRYIFNRVESEGDLVLTEWTAELLLNNDSEYREAVKSIQSTIDKNALTEYTPLEDYYSDDIVEGAVTYYPIEKLKLSGIDALKYIMVGKYANCDKEDAKHIVVLAVGFVSEENYQKGEIVKKTTVEYKFDSPELTVPPAAIEEPKEMTDFVNIALFITDKNEIKGQKRSTFIMSINKDTNEMKLVSVPRRLYLNVGDDKYHQSSRAYGVEQAIKMLNSNLDMNIGNFIAIDYKSLVEFVDVLGGVWLDVNLDGWMRNESYDESIMSLLGTNEPITLNSGYQLLNGNQLATYSWYMGTYGGYGRLREQQCEIIMAIHDQMQKVEKETLSQAIVGYISNVYSSIDTEIIQNGMQNITNYSFADSETFPQKDMCEAVNLGSEGSCIVPTDLESNVVWLHQFLFNQDNYEVTSTVKKYSEKIKEDTAEYMTK